MGDLLVQGPTRFAFTINLKTVQSLGLNIPLALIATADDTVE
jgi:putative ABC transport system substrate-binding protein